MDKSTTPRPENSSFGRRTFLLGCLAALVIWLVALGAGIPSICRAADGSGGLRNGNGTPFTSDISYRELWSAGERFIDGLMEGSIRPESGARIVSQLFLNMSDGILTKEEIGSILEQLRRADGMSL